MDKHYSIILWRKGPRIVRTNSIEIVKHLARLSFMFDIIKIIDWEAEKVIFYKSKDGEYINRIKEA